MVGADGHYLAAHGHGLNDLAGLMPISGQMVTNDPVAQALVDFVERHSR
jgi:hypothetical protein